MLAGTKFNYIVALLSHNCILRTSGILHNERSLSRNFLFNCSLAKCSCVDGSEALVSGIFLCSECFDLQAGTFFLTICLQAENIYSLWRIFMRPVSH